MATRYESLNRPRLQNVAAQIGMLAINVEKKTGAPVIFKTIWEIGQAIGEDAQTVSNALRLSYTPEFLDDQGWGFIPPGCGRSGAIYGYTMQHSSTTNGSSVAHDHLDYTDEKVCDHLNGLASHWEYLAGAHGRSTKVGKAAHAKATIVAGAAAAIATIV